MITLVDGKGEQVDDFQFQSWNEAENYLSEQRRNGKSGLYLRGDFGTPNFYNGFYFIAVDFDNCIDMGFNDLTSMVIKAKYIPCPDELMVWSSLPWIRTAIPISSLITLLMRTMFSRTMIPRTSTIGLSSGHSSPLQGGREIAFFHVVFLSGSCIPLDIQL